MKSKHHRRHLAQTLFVAALILLFTAYLKVGLLPGRLKAVAERNLTALFHEKVDFERVVYLPFRGISIDGLETKSLQGEQIFRAKHLVLKVPLLVFLFDKRIVIAKASLEHPYLAIAASESKASVSPLQTITEFLESGLDSFLPENVYMERLAVTGGRLIIHQQANRRTVIEDIQKLNLDIDFKTRPVIPLSGGFILDGGATQIRFAARWDMNRASHAMHLTGSTRKLPRWAAQKLGGWGLAFSRLSSDFEIEIMPREEALYGFRFTAKKTSAALTWKGRSFDGKFSAVFEGGVDPQTRQPQIDSGNIAVERADIAGLPKPIRALQGLHGLFAFRANELVIKKAETLWSGIPTVASGRVTLTAPHLLSLEIKQQAHNFEFAKDFAPPAAMAWIGADALNGNFEIRTVLEGEGANPGRLNREVTIVAENGVLKQKGWKEPVTALKGRVEMKNSKISLSGVSFVHAQEPYALNGAVDLAPGTPSKLRLSQRNFRTAADFSMNADGADISSIEFTSGASKIRLKGDVSSKGRKPYRLLGKGDLEMDDVRKIFQKQYPWLKVLKPAGKSSFDLKLNGDLADMKSLQAVFFSELPQIRILDKILLANAALDLRYSQDNLSLSYGKAAVYGGEVRFAGNVDLLKKEKPLFQLKVTTLGVDLAGAAKDFPSLGKDFSGWMDLELDMKGYLNDKSSYAGSGRFDVKNGKLFTTPLFKRLSNLLFVRIEGIESVTFNRAQGTFFIADSFIHSDNATLSSPLIDVRMMGKVGLDQKLDLLIHSQFASDVINQSNELGGFAPHIVNYAEGKITEYTVTGTLSKPEYKEVT